jgi:hypothetical protein
MSELAAQVAVSTPEVQHSPVRYLTEHAQQRLVAEITAGLVTVVVVAGVPALGITVPGGAYLFGADRIGAGPLALSG